MAYIINSNNSSNSNNSNNSNNSSNSNNNQQNFHRNLSTQEVKDIRAEYLQGATQKKLADTYGLSIKSIYKIVHLIDYKHIKEDDSYLTRLSERLST